MLTVKRIEEIAVELLKKSETELPSDVTEAIEKAYQQEKEGIAKTQLKNILDNIKFAKIKKIPICQDTGIPVFYVGIGSAVKIDLGIIRAGLEKGLRRATEEVPLRPNAVHPLTRKNSGDNTGSGLPVIEYDILDGKNYIEITVLPKGAGSENMTTLTLMNPSDGVAGIRKFVLETVARAGGKPCPPIIVGIGMGGNADYALKLSKKALLRRIGRSNPEKDMAKLEERLLNDVNRLGIGPMGLGGATTSLAVNIEYAYCHTASLPVAVSIQCWAGRRAGARIFEDDVEYLKS